MLTVALRKESVDRNHDGMLKYRDAEVALRKESVDRNIGVGTTRDSRGVALRKESVDRNGKVVIPGPPIMMSLSARRAWIEIFIRREISLMRPSLSARRAWIEIRALQWLLYTAEVALRKESVDRNLRKVRPSLIRKKSLSARRAWIEIHKWGQ